ncbi:unnamed protein product [Sphagnum jensenii]|uniref:Uncharacterized protein n=1 Tax=Sphagnum jensenii TaxID=128206 RepID=A0ABP1B243_9BRYO
MGKRLKREAVTSRDSNRMSGVEAAYVVESYLLKNHYHRSLAEFRIEAAPVLSSLKSAPAYVRTVTNILDECIALRVEQREYAQKKSRMERLFEGMQELLSSYQTGLLTSPSCSPAMACTPTQLFTNHSGIKQISSGNATLKESGKKPQKGAVVAIPGCPQFATKSSSPPGVSSGNPSMPPTVIQRARRQSRTMALPQQLTSHPMTLDTSNQAPHPSFPFLMPPPNPSWGTVKPVTVSSTCNAQLQALSPQSSPAPLQQQHQCSSPLDPSSPPKSQKQGNIEATKPVQEANDKGPCTPPQQPLGEKNMSPNISFSNALQETNSGVQSAPLSQSSLQKSTAKVPRPHKENCPPVSSEMPHVDGLRHAPPMMRRNQASKKRAFSSPTHSRSPKKRKSMPVPVAAPKETPQCPQVPSGSPSSDFLCSSMNSEDQNKELFSNQVHLEDTSNEVPSKLEADLCSSQFGSPELHSTDSLWILPEDTPRDLSSTHGNSADSDPLSSSLPSASHLDKDSGFNLIETGDSQGCGDNLDMSEPLISIDDILEWEGCCFGDLMSDMLSDNMKGSSTTEDCLTDLCTSSRGLKTPDRFEYNCLVEAIDYEGQLPQLSVAVANKDTSSGSNSQAIEPA